VQGSPRFTLDIEEVHLAVSVRVLSANKNDFCWRNSQGRAGPEWVLHTDCQNDPGVLVHIVDFNSIIDLLLGAAEEATKSVDEFVVDRAGAEIVTLVFHNGHLRPFVLLDLVSLDRIQALLSGKASKDVDVAATHGDRVGVPTLIHRALACDLILQSQVEPGVLLGRRPTSCDQDLVWRESDGCGALVELACAAVSQFLDRPLVFVHVVAQADLRIDIVSEQVYPRRLILGSLKQID